MSVGTSEAHGFVRETMRRRTIGGAGSETQQPVSPAEELELDTWRRRWEESRVEVQQAEERNARLVETLEAGYLTRQDILREVAKLHLHPRFLRYTWR